MSYEIDLAREIIEKKETTKTKYIDIQSQDTEFLLYKDDYIEIISAINTKSLHVRIYKPLTSGGSNPIIYVDDEGNCYRNHGERGRFIMYAERLLNKEITIGLYEHNISKQENIDKLFTRI